MTWCLISYRRNGPYDFLTQNMVCMNNVSNVLLQHESMQREFPLKKVNILTLSQFAFLKQRTLLLMFSQKSLCFLDQESGQCSLLAFSIVMEVMLFLQRIDNKHKIWFKNCIGKSWIDAPILTSLKDNSCRLSVPVSCLLIYFMQWFL